MPLFQIETYKVSSYLQRFTGETTKPRTGDDRACSISWHPKPGVFQL